MSVIRDQNNVLIQFNKDIFYFNKSELMQNLAALESGDVVLIDGSRTTFIDHDIFLTLEEFQAEAKSRHINIEFKNIKRRKLKYRKSNGIVSKTLISE